MAYDAHAPRDSRTTYPNGKEMKKRSGVYLTKKVKATGFSRKEAAERADVTEGYLSGLLAGRIILPSPKILDSMARHWGFPVVEYFIEVGLIGRHDLETYLAKAGLTPGFMPEDIQTLVGRLMALKPECRKEVCQAIHAMLTAFAATGDEHIG